MINAKQSLAPVYIVFRAVIVSKEQLAVGIQKVNERRLMVWSGDIFPPLQRPQQSKRVANLSYPCHFRAQLRSCFNQDCEERNRQ